MDSMENGASDAEIVQGPRLRFEGESRWPAQHWRP